MSSTSQDDASAYPPIPEPGSLKREGARAAEDTAQKPPPRKRRRVVISCTECHRRKQKCDRSQPCANCVSRNKQDACQYDSSAPTAKEQRKNSRTEEASPEQPPVESIPSKVADFGYSQTGASTLGFLKKIEGVSPEEPLSRLDTDAGQHGDHFNTKERYKSLIRQLPARMYIDKLVDLYFSELNWQYYPLDRDVFDRQLAEWYSLPFSLLANGGPHALSPDLRPFPALLFQMMATSLLVLPSGPDLTFDSLKYTGNMTFEDLAVDYSESGVAILSLLGKRQMSLTTILAGFLRAGFLKYVALVTESWHAIGSAIRDAQEIGLHRDSLDPKPKADDAESVLENQWEIQRRRKLWMILVSWDIHTGVVLGRPTTIDPRAAPPSLPVDAPIPRDRSKAPVAVRDEDSPPTPLTRALWASTLMAPLREVLDLEKEGPCPKDFSKVDQLHQKLLDIEAQTPSYFRLENPDTRYDGAPGCHWISSVRATLAQITSFNFIALHRPYIFTYPKSRTEALKASLNMLHAQRLHFQSLKPQQYKTFSLFFGTFDAIVLMASIYILFPKEHPELVQSAIQHFRWAVERFEAMSERNALAKAALGVLQAIYMRLKKFLGITCQAAGNMISSSNTSSPLAMSSGTPTSANSTSTSNSTFRSGESPLQSETPVDSRTSTVDTSVASSRSSITPASSDVFSGPAAATANAVTERGFDWMPNDMSWANLQPIYATSDLVYNDLVGIRDDTTMPQWVATEPSLLTNDTLPWQFDGDFGNDSVWSLLNQYTPL